MPQPPRPRGVAEPYLGDGRPVPELSEEAGEVPQSPADLLAFLGAVRHQEGRLR